MVESDNGTIRAVAWKELFPWLNLFRVFRLSIAFPAILFGALAVLLMSIGWCAIATVFSTETQATAWLTPYVNCPWTAVTRWVPDRPGPPSHMIPGPACPSACVLPSQPCPLMPAASDQPCPCGKTHTPPFHGPFGGPHVVEPYFSSWSLLNSPIREGLLTTGLTFRTLLCLFLCGLWGVTIWAFFGAAITRIAAVQLATGERIGMAAAIRHAGAKWPSYFAAPLLPIGGVMLAAIPVLLLGLLARVNLFLFLAGLIWPLVLIAGFVMALLLLGTLFGWPLMWATISTEGTDSFDALSRSYAYTFQRPLRYLFYAVVAAMVGGLGWLLVRNFASGIIWMGYWAAGLGCGGARLESIMGVGEPLKGLGWAGVSMVHLWTGCVKLLAVGYLFSYFWTASTCIYFLLRRDVDATQMDEVYLDADANEDAAPLPPIGSDASGAPVVDETPAKAPGEDVVAKDDGEPPLADSEE